MWCFLLNNSELLNLLCVWVLFYNDSTLVSALLLLGVVLELVVVVMVVVVVVVVVVVRLATAWRGWRVCEA